MESESVKPTFGISKSGEHVGPGKGLVVGSVVIGLETSVDEGTFRLGEKFCSGGVVLNKEVGA